MSGDKDNLIKRYYTLNANWFNEINFVPRTAHIEDNKGKVIFHQDNVIVPDFWSQTAVNILVQKYFRKAGVPVTTFPKLERSVPGFLWRSIPAKNTEFTGENSLKQVVDRIVGHWAYTGWKEGYFEDHEETHVFCNELKYMFYHQIAAPNSPQWFNTGLWWAYGITGKYDHYADNFNTGVIEPVDSYERPQIHACFINKVEDHIIGKDGIMDLFAKEARIFKYGSGSGCNYSAIRGKNEPLSGGGVSSGLISFLKIGDTTGGAIKSGGTTRRAARAVILDDDHPDLIEFIQWKVKEEQKAQALIAGSQALNNEDNNFPIYPASFEGEAYGTISGQNANNSVRVSNDFMFNLEHGYNWTLMPRVDDCTNEKILPAKEIWDELAKSAWQCGDPGVIFKDHVNAFNTCLDDEEIIANNPCFEYLWFTNTACNLASLNLLKFYEDEIFNIKAFKHAAHLWTIVLDISNDLAGYPTLDIANKTYKYRTIGLGYTNLGALLMVMGLSYDSDKARNIAADITSLMTAQAYLTSSKLADKLGAFVQHEKNKSSMLDVIEAHYRAIKYDGERINEINWEADYIWQELCSADYNIKYRNAQVTVLAPTGTISFVMDAQTTGIEPAFALIAHKELAGGGTLKLINKAPEQALDSMNYEPILRNKIIDFIIEHGTIRGCNLVDPSSYSIFDCANDIKPSGHLNMVAAVQPFVSGGISKTINLPNYATVEDIQKIYLDAWHKGVKCISVYRDGCKSSQPLVAVKNPSPSKEAEILPVERNAIMNYKEEKKNCKTCGHPIEIMAGVCYICPVCGTSSGGCS